MYEGLRIQRAYIWHPTFIKTDPNEFVNTEPMLKPSGQVKMWGRCTCKTIQPRDFYYGKRYCSRVSDASN